MKPQPNQKQSGPVEKIRILAQVTRFGLRNKNHLSTDKMGLELRQILTRANMEIGTLSYHDPIYIQRTQEYDQAVLELERGRYFWNQALDTGVSADWRTAKEHFTAGLRIANVLLEYLTQGSDAKIPFEQPVFSNGDGEILYDNQMPLHPEVMPVIFLQGSDFEMGYQYAQQVIRIYGKWIMQRKAGVSAKFSPVDRACQREWEKQMEQYAPELLAFSRGWAAGACDSGVHMSYEDVLDLWTGHQPPAKIPFNLSEVGLPAHLNRPFCSGTAAWGRATVDGNLVTGSTGDHNPDFAAAILAFPVDGNHFFAMPFQVTGGIRGIPHIFMSGHPGMNNKGLAYVEHGGEPKMVEPMDQWGYGLRKGTVIFHVLRYANSAREALEMELSYPVGDVGTLMGVGGCFWADSTYGFNLECRKDPVAVRETGMLGETDFLYAMNGLMHPDLDQVWWMERSKENWKLDPHGGWYPEKFKYFQRGMLGNPWEVLDLGIHFYQRQNRDRCLHLFKLLDRAGGKIDFEYMKMVYRNGGTLPAGEWKEISQAYKKTGDWGDTSPAHSTNTVTAVLRPVNGDAGKLALCHGPAKRGMAPFAPTQVIAMRGETNAFWELTLAARPLDVTEAASHKARETLEQARHEVGRLNPASPAWAPLHAFIERAEHEYQAGAKALNQAGSETGNEAIYSLSRSARCFTRAQVRALQAYQGMVPPPSGPEDFGI